MKYYKVKNEYDNVSIYKKISDTHYQCDGRVLVGGELYTEKEYEKLCECHLVTRAKREDIFEVVDIPKNKTYIFFGCRFQS